jgi:hypothetical protein
MVDCDNGIMTECGYDGCPGRIHEVPCELCNGTDTYHPQCAGYACCVGCIDHAELCEVLAKSVVVAWDATGKPTKVVLKTIPDRCAPKIHDCSNERDALDIGVFKHPLYVCQGTMFSLPTFAMPPSVTFEDTVFTKRNDVTYPQKTFGRQHFCEVYGVLSTYYDLLDVYDVETFFRRYKPMHTTNPIPWPFTLSELVTRRGPREAMANVTLHDTKAILRQLKEARNDGRAGTPVEPPKEITETPEEKPEEEKPEEEKPEEEKPKKVEPTRKRKADDSEDDDVDSSDEECSVHFDDGDDDDDDDDEVTTLPPKATKPKPAKRAKKETDKVDAAKAEAAKVAAEAKAAKKKRAKKPTCKVCGINFLDSKGVCTAEVCPSHGA